MKSLISSGLALLILSLSPAKVLAEMETHPQIQVRPSVVHCMSQTDLSNGWKKEGMKIIISAVDENNTIKVVAINANKDVMVVTILPDNSACVLDFLKDAYIGVTPDNPPTPPVKGDSS
jgi:hypothetical protein